MSTKNGSWLTTALTQAVAVIAIVFWAVATVTVAVIGLLVVAVVWIGITIWEWLTSRAVLLGHDLFSLMRYLATGDCGHICEYATFYVYDTGKRIRPFVPEAGCPVHDNDSRFSRWAQKVKKGDTT